MKIAKNQNGQIISAKDGNNHDTYFCLNCNEPLKWRQGRHTIPHFYHIKKSKQQASYESQEHLSGKKLLASFATSARLPYECEHAISHISRRADIIVGDKYTFEIQCSRISNQEIANRTLAYSLMDWQLIWLNGKKNHYQTQNKFLNYHQTLGFHTWDLFPKKIKLYYHLTNSHISRYTKIFDNGMEFFSFLQQPKVITKEAVSVAPIIYHRQQQQAKNLWYKNSDWLLLQEKLYLADTQLQKLPTHYYLPTNCYFRNFVEEISFKWHLNKFLNQTKQIDLENLVPHLLKQFAFCETNYAPPMLVENDFLTLAIKNILNNYYELGMLKVDKSANYWDFQADKGVNINNLKYLIGKNIFK